MGHDHEELLEANLIARAHFILMLVPFIEECSNNLLPDWVVGEGRYAVQVFSTYCLFISTQLLESLEKVFDLLE